MELDVHVASFSTQTAVYKVMGAPPFSAALLPRPARPPRRDRLDPGPQPLLDQHVAVVQARAAVLVLGHNGEINTIARLRQEAQMTGARPRGRIGLPGPEPDDRDPDPPARPDAGRGDRAGPPPIVNEVKQLPPGPARLLHVPAPGMGPFAQGPIALIARQATSTCSPSTLSAYARCGRSRRRHLRVLLRAGRRAGGRHDRPSPSRSPRARRSWCGRPDRGARLLDHGRCSTGLRRPLAQASRRGGDDYGFQGRS